MDRRKKLYNDILNGIILIEEFVIGINSYDQYISDYKSKSAIERQLAIIGEAITQIRKIDQEELLKPEEERNNSEYSELINARKIIGLRNIIVHAYDSVDDSVIWAIIQRHLPPLKQEVADRLIND